MTPAVLECVVNVSEGRDPAVVGAIAAAGAEFLLDVHRDPDHNRAVLTMAGPADTVVPAARALAATAVARLDLRSHEGAHPRLGVLDVVPFVPYEPGGPCPEDLSGAVVLRDDFARWLGAELGVPSFLYGPLPGGRTRTLPDIRRHAFGTDGAPDGGGLTPDYGPARAEGSARSPWLPRRRGMFHGPREWIPRTQSPARTLPLAEIQPRQCGHQGQQAQCKATPR